MLRAIYDICAFDSQKLNGSCSDNILMCDNHRVKTRQVIMVYERAEVGRSIT